MRGAAESRTTTTTKAAGLRMRSRQFTETRTFTGDDETAKEDRVPYEALEV